MANYQVSHVFQHMLDAEKTPTLCHSIPAFSAFIQRWNDLAEDHPNWKPIIEPGVEKLAEYQENLSDTPAYVVAMGNITLLVISPY